MRRHKGRGLPLLLLAIPLAACASAGGTAVKPSGPVDLGPALAALEEARRAGAPQRAAETFRQAEAHLKEAEALRAGGGLTAEQAQRAESLGKLAAAEAHCAASLAQLYSRGAPGPAAARGEDADLAGRLRRAEVERHRLEERVTLLQRELELTETEVVRSKAQVPGVESKAEASSAIAEARILMGRVDARDRATLSRCQELLRKAEQQINENNFGAAVFFARKVQEMVAQARESSPSQP